MALTRRLLVQLRASGFGIKHRVNQFQSDRCFARGRRQDYLWLGMLRRVGGNQGDGGGQPPELGFRTVV
jgi:hypothetical protein